MSVQCRSVFLDKELWDVVVYLLFYRKYRQILLKRTRLRRSFDRSPHTHPCSAPSFGNKIVKFYLLYPELFDILSWQPRNVITTFFSKMFKRL
jgi:hypothetical protein